MKLRRLTSDARKVLDCQLGCEMGASPIEEGERMEVRGPQLQLPERKTLEADCAASTLTLPVSLAKGERTIRALGVPPGLHR